MSRRPKASSPFDPPRQSPTEAPESGRWNGGTRATTAADRPSAASRRAPPGASGPPRSRSAGRRGAGSRASRRLRGSLATSFEARWNDSSRRKDRPDIESEPWVRRCWRSLSLGRLPLGSMVDRGCAAGLNFDRCHPDPCNRAASQHDHRPLHRHRRLGCARRSLGT